MKLLPTELSGVFVIETDTFEDNRGTFVKTFNEDAFKDLGIEIDFKESFYSRSKKNVIRGMHFHTPPKDHSKLVYVTQGSVVDVVLDLRKDSPTYGHHVSKTLSATNKKMMYIPTGCAHGFVSLEDNTCTVYLQTGMYSKEHDGGIHFESFGMDWGAENPIVSKRDMDFVKFADFDSPF